MSLITAATAAEWRSHLSDTEKGNHGGISGAFAAKPHLSANSRSRKQMNTGGNHEQRNPSEEIHISPAR